MALTLPRWIALTVVACAVTWFGVLRAGVNEPRPAQSDDIPFGAPVAARSPAVLLGKQLAAANERLRMLQLRDSVMRVVDKTNATAGSARAQLSILFDAGFPPVIQRSVESQLRARWAALQIVTELPVVIAAVVDSSREPNGFPRANRFFGIPIEIFLPGLETGGRCLSIIHLPFSPEYGGGYRQLLVRNLSSPETIDAALSSCAFLAAFGEPGAEIGQWAWGVAAWDQPASPWSAVIPVSYSYDLTRGLATAGDATWRIRDFVAPGGIACFAGRPNACKRILLRATRASPSTADSIWRHNIVATNGTDASAFYRPSGASELGPADRTILSEMVRTLGRDRFTRFWRSSLPVDAAFAAASGTDLDGWLRDWGTRIYGRAAIGPVISVLGLVAGGITLAIAMLVAIEVERRRRVV